MEEPSLSELELWLHSLQYKITNLKIDSNTTPDPPPLEGTIIPAGSVFYCRPSKLNKLIERLGGLSNVQIMDTEDTRGFCRGKSKPALPWTNEVYPTDIGPSCDGIDSDTPRIAVTINNNCITPTAWDPLKMYQSDKQLDNRPAFTHCYSVQRVAWLHKSPLTAFTYLLNYRSSILNRWSKVMDPISSGISAFPPNCFKTVERTIIINIDGGGGGWTGDNSTNVINVETVEDLDYWMKEYVSFPNGISVQIWPENELCLIEQQGASNTGLLLAPQTPAQCLPFQIKIFQINSNTIENSSNTPTLRYGGYDRKNGTGTGPAPKWNRTNLIQIKTINAVSVDIRTDPIS